MRWGYFFAAILLGFFGGAAASDVVQKIDLLCDSLLAHLTVHPEKKHIAVLPFTNKTGQPDQGQGIAVAERFIARISAQKTFALVDRVRFDKAMAEIALSQTGVVDDSMALDAGKFMAADYLLTGSITSAFGSCVISATLIQTETGKVMASVSQNVAPMALDGLRKELLGEKATVGASLFRSMVVPGWGQFYADRHVRGVLSLAAFLGASGYLGYRVYQTAAAQEDYDRAYASVKGLLNNNAAGLKALVVREMAADGLDSTSSAYQTYLVRILQERLLDVETKEETYIQSWNNAAIAGGILAGVWALNAIDAAIAGAQSKKKFKLYFSAAGGSAAISVCGTF